MMKAIFLILRLCLAIIGFMQLMRGFALLLKRDESWLEGAGWRYPVYIAVTFLGVGALLTR